MMIAFGIKKKKKKTGTAGACCWLRRFWASGQFTIAATGGKANQKSNADQSELLSVGSNDLIGQSCHLLPTVRTVENVGTDTWYLVAHVDGPSQCVVQNGTVPSRPLFHAARYRRYAASAGGSAWFPAARWTWLHHCRLQHHLVPDGGSSSTEPTFRYFSDHQAALFHQFVPAVLSAGELSWGRLLDAWLGHFGALVEKVGMVGQSAFPAADSLFSAGRSTGISAAVPVSLRSAHQPLQRKDLLHLVSLIAVTSWNKKKISHCEFNIRKQKLVRRPFL